MSVYLDGLAKIEAEAPAQFHAAQRPLHAAWQRQPGIEAGPPQLRKLVADIGTALEGSPTAAERDGLVKAVKDAAPMLASVKGKGKGKGKSRRERR